MYRDLTLWTWISRRVLTEGASLRQIARETGICRRTLRKMIELPAPPECPGREPVAGSNLWPCFGLIDLIVKEDQGKPRKQQRNATQIWGWLKREYAFSGDFKIVRSYVRQARQRIASGSITGPSQRALRPPAVKRTNLAEATYRLILSLSKREAIGLVRTMFGGGSPQFDMERLTRLLEPFATRDVGEEMRLRARQAAFDWMRKVLQGEISLDALAVELGEISNLKELVAVIRERRMSERDRALAVLGRAKGIDPNIVSAFLYIAPRTVTYASV